MLEIPSFNPDWKCHAVIRSVTCLLWDPASASVYDYSINHWNNHSILTPLDYNAEADVASHPSCAMSVATRVLHMSSANTVLDKKKFLKRGTVCTNMHWHQVSHWMTHRKTPLLSTGIKRTLRGSPSVQVPSTPQILPQTSYWDPACSHMDTSHAASSPPSWHCSLPVHTKSCHTLRRWLSIPKRHPWLSSCQFSRYSS